MADIRALRGWRYNLARVGELSDVVAPPYDVIGPELQDVLYTRHPANVVRLELNKAQPDDSNRGNCYTRAARQLHEWKLDGTLVEDPDPAIYVCHQEFTVQGRQYTRRGFLARLKLEPFGTGQVFPHEETMPGPKADRLRLFHATGMNLSPVFGLYPDPTHEVEELLDGAIRGLTPLEAVDHLGVTSRLWVLNQHELVSRVQGLMGPRPVFIADGHHRYETSLRYRDERRAADAVRGGEPAADFVLMMFVAMSDAGLVILPTHRLVTGQGGVRFDVLQAGLESEFEIDPMGSGAAAGRETWELIEADGTQNAIGLCSVTDGHWLLARLRGSAVMEQLVPHHSPAWRELAVSILHELILGKLLHNQIGEKSLSLRYVHLLSEVLDAVAAGQCDLACLVPAATAQHLQQIAKGGERMPPKSTYFYPKILTGLVFNPIV